MANIERLVLDWLNHDPALQPVRAYVSVPQGASSAQPGTFITIEQVGGTVHVFSQTALLAIQAWASTRFTASQLAYAVVDALRTMARDASDVIDVDITGLTHFPTDTGWPRYQIAATVTAHIADETTTSKD